MRVEVPDLQIDSQVSDCILNRRHGLKQYLTLIEIEDGEKYTPHCLTLTAANNLRI